MSISNTPQAKDDAFAGVENRTATFDVMANDLGGAAKSLYSVDQSNPLNAVTSARSALGAAIRIVDGKVVYDSTGAAALEKLAAGQTATDSFQYVIQLGNGTLSVATVTVAVTGTNDGPLLSADPVASHALTEIAGVTGSAATDTATATLAFSDVDLSDTHSVSIGAPAAIWSAGTVPAATLTALNAALTSALQDSTGTGAGSVGLTFSAADKAFDFLGQGQTLSVTYNVTVTDNSGTAATRPVAFVVTGTNDGPVLAADATGPHAMAEAAGVTGSSTVDSASATLTFTDADLTDTHTVSVAAPTIAWSGGSALPAGLAAKLGGALTTSLTEAGGAGSLTATLAAPDSTFDFLSAGETLTVTYDVTINDGHGGSATRPVTFVVNGANDAVVVNPDASGPHVLIERANLIGSDLRDEATATLTGTDPDLSDTHLVTFGAPTISWSGGVVPAGVAAQLALAISEGDGVDSTGTGQGTAVPRFSIPDKVIDFLAQGETLTVTYDVHVDDGHGSVSTRPVTFTILGTNDRPVLLADAAGPHAIAEAVGVTGSAAIDGATASLNFFGVDATDQHTVSVAAPTIVWSGGAALPPGLAATLASSLHTSLSQPSGPGTLTATFEAPDKTFDFLSEGETLTVTYAVTLDDGHGGAVTRPVTFVVTGANDPEVLNPDASGPHVLTESAFTNSPILLTGTATLTGREVDLNDDDDLTMGAPTLVWSGGQLIPGGPLSQLFTGAVTVEGTDRDADGNGSAVLTLKIADKAMDFLAAGETLTVTYPATLDDHHGSTVSQPVTFTIVGANDAPNMNAQASLEHVVNGGFEVTDRTAANFAWTNANGHGVEIYSAGTYGVSGASGQTMEIDVDLGQPADDVSQVINTVAGQAYSFSFDSAARAGYPGATNNFEVLWNGVVIDTVAPSSTAMVHHSYTVMADGGTAKIEFREINSDGVGGIVDNVSVKDAIAERAGVTGSAAADTASVTFTLVDLDRTDVHTVTRSLTNVVWSGGATPAGLANTLDAALSTSIVDTTGQATGSLTATFSAPDTTFDFLAQGQTLALTYSVTVSDGHGGAVTRPVNFIITGTNDAAIIGGLDDASVTEDESATTLTATGQLSVTDADTGEAAFNTAVVAGPGAFGSLTLASNGTYTYAVANAATQSLGAGQVHTDTFTVSSLDGTTQQFSFLVNGVNDPAVITGTSTGVVLEAGAAGPGVPTATGDLLATDVDNAFDSFRAVATPTASAHGYGTYTVSESGVWTYNLDNANSSVHALHNGQSLADSFTVLSADGTAKVVNITINGADDASIKVAVIGSSHGTQNAVAAQLNDDTHFNFDATSFSTSSFSTAADWKAALAGFNSIVIGGSGYFADGLEFTNSGVLSAIRQLADQGIGVVTSSWYDAVILDTSGSGQGDADYISPIKYVDGSYNSTGSAMVVSSAVSPVTNGVGVMNSGPQGTWEIAQGLDAGATVLVTSQSNSSLVGAASSQLASGAKLVYIGAVYFGYGGYNEAAFRTGESDHLLENSVAWTSGWLL